MNIRGVHWTHPDLIFVASTSSCFGNYIQKVSYGGNFGGLMFPDLHFHPKLAGSRVVLAGWFQVPRPIGMMLGHDAGLRRRLGSN